MANASHPDGIFGVDEAAEASGATTEQLRYWDRRRLLRPSVQSSDGRRGRQRLYSWSDVAWARALTALRNEGMSTQRLRLYLADIVGLWTPTADGDIEAATREILAYLACSHHIEVAEAASRARSVSDS